MIALNWIKSIQWDKKQTHIDKVTLSQLDIEMFSIVLKFPLLILMFYFSRWCLLELVNNTSKNFIFHPQNQTIYLSKYLVSQNDTPHTLWDVFQNSMKSFAKQIECEKM